MRLSAHGVGCRLPSGRWLFTDLSFTCLPGRLTALTGPSGSGKSTLIAILGGTQLPTLGQVAREEIRHIDRVHQRAYGTSGRSVVDHVAMPLVASGETRASATRGAVDILATFGLTEVAHQRYASLSGGERQRVMLARSVARRPDLILADEPTASLDSASATTVVEVLERLADGGAIVVIATHDGRVRAACHDEVALL